MLDGTDPDDSTKYNVFALMALERMLTYNVPIGNLAIFRFTHATELWPDSTSTLNKDEDIIEAFKNEIKVTRIQRTYPSTQARMSFVTISFYFAL